MNGKDRLNWRDAQYFNLVQNYETFHNFAEHVTFMYNFSLDPKNSEPSGSCNFSRLDNCKLHLEVDSNIVNTNNTAYVRIYALNYNVLRIENGMGGLAYSN